MEMKKWSYANLITLALLFLFFIILLLAFQGGSRDDDHQHAHVAISTKDISMGRKLKSLKPINPRKKNRFEYPDQGSNDLQEREVYVDLMDYRQRKYNPPVHN
ncbi:Root meristem growth factor 7 [Arabidopsis thaliana]